MSKRIIGITVGTPMNPQTIVNNSEQAKQLEENTESIGELTNSLGELTEQVNNIPPSPTKVSELENDKNYATQEDLKNIEVVTSWNDLKDKPSIPTKTSDLTNDSGYLSSIPEEYVTETELENKGYLTEHQNLSDYAKKNELPIVPTNVSAFNNDKGYLTEVPSEYITESELNAKGYLTSISQEVAIQSAEPTEGSIWIDTDSSDEIILAEIDDNTVSNEKTWSSSKINEEIVNQNVLNPDSFTGTDSEKLQACFDELATSGGVISINRTYTLTENIKIKHISGDSQQIYVVGTGKVAGIDFGNYSFVGYDTSTKDQGGIVFEHLRLSGTGIAFNCNNLIRLFFNSCAIRQFTHLAYSDDYIQTIYLNDCAIRRSLGATIKTASNSNGICYDVRIRGCLCEWGTELFHVYSAYGCSIVQNCIEGYTATPIIVEKYMHMLDISSNYLELNANGVSVDFSSIDSVVNANVSHNSFIENTTTKGSILLPKTLTNNLIISGNIGTTLVEVPSDATNLSGVYCFANNGNVIDTKKALTVIEPADIIEMMKSQVYTVNGKTGYVNLTASDVGATTESWVQTKLNAISTQGVQQTPLFANSIEECKDGTKLYVLPSGYIYAYMSKEIIVEAPNVMPTVGYELGLRINSSGVVTSSSAPAEMGVTGSISAKVGDVLDISGYKFNSSYTSYIATYKGTTCTGKKALDYTTPSSFSITLDSATFGIDFDNVRISGNITSALSVINQSDGGVKIESSWENTNHAFVPADYEDRILALEQKVAELTNQQS